MFALAKSSISFHKIAITTFIILIFFALAPKAYATPSTAIPSTIKVGVIEEMPFSKVIDANNGIGFELALWERVAKENHWYYIYIPITEGYSKALSMLQSKQIDVFMGVTPVTKEERKNFDYSRPYYINHIDLLTLSEQNSVLSQMKYILLAFFGNAVLLALLITLLSCVHLIWFFEHREKHIYYGYGRSYIPGIFYCLWYVVDIFLHGRMAPYRHLAKGTIFITALWRYFSAFSYTSIIAMIMTSFVLSVSKVHEADESLKFRYLTDKNVGIVSNEILAGIVSEYGGRTVLLSSFEHGMELLKKKQIEGIADYSAVINYYLKISKLQNMRHVDLNLGMDEFAMMFRKGSALTLPFDLTLIKLQDKGVLAHICKEYMSEKDAELCAL